MKRIDAYWEERNLGCSTVEFLIEKEDKVSDVQYEINCVQSSYTVLKIPSDCHEFLLYFQRQEFVYIEDQIRMEHDLHTVEYSRVVQRLYDAMTYRIMDERDYAQLLEEVGQNMFITDRISLDPYFSIETAAKRYTNWIQDLIKKGAYLYVMDYKDSSAGFVILTTKDNKNYESILGGGYRSFRETGLGIVQKEQEIVRALGGKKLYSSVSSNNPAQMRAMVLNGYVPIGVTHVLIKHQ